MVARFAHSPFGLRECFVMTYSKDDFAENWDSIVTNAHIRLRKTVQFVDIRVVAPSATPVLFQTLRRLMER